MARWVLTTTALLALAFYASLWAADLMVSCLDDPQVAAVTGGAVFSYTILLAGATTVAFFLSVLLLQLRVAGLALTTAGKVTALTAAFHGAACVVLVPVQQV